MKSNCSVTSHLEIVPAGLEEYKQLLRFHYRDIGSTPYAAIYSIRESHPVRGRFREPVGVIVYTMPALSLELRNFATGGVFSGFGGKLIPPQRINECIRCISRVIIDPRYRGLGLAARLVRETMPLLKVAIIESMAVMGQINPFFEKAGMTAYSAPQSVRCVRMLEALSLVGIEERMLIDPEGANRKIELLGAEAGNFIGSEIKRFMQSYGKRRKMAAGLERTRFILSKLTLRPVYYIWFNPEFQNDEQGHDNWQPEGRQGSVDSNREGAAAPR